MVKLSVSDRIYVDPAGLSISLAGDLKAEFEHKNPTYYRIKSQGFWPPKSEPQTICTWRLEDGGLLSFPRGGLSRIFRILDSYGEQWEVENNFVSTEAAFPLIKLTPYDYQQRCIDTAIEKKIGIIRAPTGSGKTILGLALIARLDIPFMIVVNNAALLTQWEERIAAVFGGTDGEAYEIGRIQGRNFRLRPITLAMAQTLHRLPQDRWNDINAYFGGVILDEVQIAAASTFMSSIDRCRAEYRIGLSADHTRKDRKEFLIHDVFGEVIEEVSRDDLIARSFVLDVDVILKPSDFEAEWYSKQRLANHLRLGGMDYENVYLELKKKWPDMEYDDVPSGMPEFGKLLDEMVADEQRNSLVFELVNELIGEGRRVFVLSHRVEHCNALVEMFNTAGIKAGMLVGGVEGRDEFQRTIDGLQNGDYLVGVGTWQALGTAIDCSRVSGGVMATPINGKQIWGQIRGRLCRSHPGKTDAKMFYIWDKKLFGNSPVKNMKSWNSSCSVEDEDGLIDARSYLKRC